MGLLAARLRRRTPKLEHCWLVVGRRQSNFWLGRRVKRTVGSQTSVAFDPHWAIQREEERGDVLGFYHTHPAGTPGPSQRDVNTMRSWVDAFGKPLLCLIEASQHVGCFVFDDLEANGREIECERFPRGIILAHERAFDNLEELEATNDE